MFDVNDNLGHPIGDRMIIKAAEIVSTAFEANGGECFRIGGDEFAVIMRGDNVKERCDKSLWEFGSQMERHNGTPNSEFRISIAHGSFIYDSECGLDRIMDAYKAADEKMYENKREMKAHQSTPEEYYSEIRGLRVNT